MPFETRGPPNCATMSKTNMIPSSLFNIQRWDPQHDERAARLVGRKRGSSFLLNLPNLDIDLPNEGPTETIRKALTVLSNAQVPFLSNNLDCKESEEIDLKPLSDALSVSTASTASMREELSDIEIDNEDEVPITSLPPDALFIVEGREFPCHTKLLSKEARPLLDILSRDGAIERKTKRRRTSSSSQDQQDGVDEPWSTPSGITVARLSDHTKADFFEVLMEFLYTTEIRMKLPEGFHEDDQQDDPWLFGNEDIFDDFEEDENGEVPSDLLHSSSEDESIASQTTPLKFLQGAFSVADRFGCASLKSSIEHKIYDEFLFSFTAKDLVTWADQNGCAFLKEKAMDKLPATNA